MTISTDDFRRALQQEGVLRPGDIELLETIFFAKDCRASAGQLRKILGKEAPVEVSGAFGRLGGRIADTLKVERPIGRGEKPKGWKVLAEGEQAPEGFMWTLREELVEALLALNLLRAEAQALPEEIDKAEDLVEGATTRIAVNAYERNPVARRLCLDHHGYACCVCRFDFEATYGEIGRRYIHVHHLVGLASIGTDYLVDPIEDLVPVCPNCHAMLHQRKPAFTPEELAQRISK